MLDQVYPEGEKRLEYTQIRNDKTELPTLSDVDCLVRKIRQKIEDITQNPLMKKYL